MTLVFLSRQRWRTYTPGNGPLLGTDDSASLRRLSQLRYVDGHLRTADADGEAVDETANDQLADAVGSRSDQTADAPDDGTDLDCATTAKEIGDETGHQRADEGTAGHGGGDAALRGRGWTGAVAIHHAALVEEALVLLGAQTWGKLAKWTTQFVAIGGGSKTYMADIEAMSKPNRAPPMTAMVVM